MIRPRYPCGPSAIDRRISTLSIAGKQQATTDTPADIAFQNLIKPAPAPGGRALLKAHALRRSDRAPQTPVLGNWRSLTPAIRQTPSIICIR